MFPAICRASNVLQFKRSKDQNVTSWDKLDTNEMVVAGRGHRIIESQYPRGDVRGQQRLAPPSANSTDAMPLLPPLPLASEPHADSRSRAASFSQTSSLVSLLCASLLLLRPHQRSPPPRPPPLPPLPLHPMGSHFNACAHRSFGKNRQLKGWMGAGAIQAIRRMLGACALTAAADAAIRVREV